MAELEIESGTDLTSILWYAPWVDDGSGDGGLMLDLPSGVNLAISLQVLDKHGNESFTGVWICLGVWGDSKSVKIQSIDSALMNQTIIDYVFPRTFTKDSTKQEMKDLTGYGLVIDHIHVSQDTIDKYKTLLGVAV